MPAGFNISNVTTGNAANGNEKGTTATAVGRACNASSVKKMTNAARDSSIDSQAQISNS